MDRPSILILGWARHGKDTVAERLRDAHGFTFRSSSLFLAEKVVMPELARYGLIYDTLEQCYADRVNCRSVWRAIIEQYNSEDPARLAKAILAKADCYVGMRMEREYQAAEPLFDHVIWVDATGRGVPPEDHSSMTIEFDRERMLWLDNSGTLEELHRKVDRIARRIWPQDEYR